MTEEEKTALAMKSAQNAQKKINESKISESLDKVAPEKPETTETPKTPKATKTPKLAKNQIKMGSRIVTLTPWSGKTKKKFKKELEFVERMEDIDFQRILEILVYDHTAEDIQFTDAELQYLLVELKLRSIGPKIECEAICKKCESNNTIKTTVKDVLSFSPDKLPVTYKNWEFKNTTRTEFLKLRDEILESDDYDGLTSESDIELACKISKDKKSPKEMIQVFDDTPLNELEDVLTHYQENIAECDISLERECDSCGKTQTFEIDIITGIFETIAK